MNRARDESGAIQVVEAILVAVLVGSALIFFALSQRPTVPPSGPATDLAQVATDTLVILQGNTPGDSGSDELTRYAYGAITAADLKTALTALLPDGMQYRLQFTSDSGLTGIAAVTSTTSSPGAGAQAGVAYVVDNDGTAGAPKTLYRAELVVWDVF